MPVMPRDPELSLTTRRTAAGALVAAAGAIDIATAPQLRDAVVTAAGGARHVVLDLRSVDFIDSSGLGTLLNLRAELRRAGARFVVEAEDGPVRRAIEMTGLGELLEA